jgi:hypothetical protein
MRIVQNSLGMRPHRYGIIALPRLQYQASSQPENRLSK